MRISVVGLKSRIKTALTEVKKIDAAEYAEFVAQKVAEVQKAVGESRKYIIKAEKALAKGDTEVLKQFPPTRYNAKDPISPRQEDLERALGILEIVTEGDIPLTEANKLVGNVLGWL